MADIQSLSQDADFMRLSPEAQGHVLRSVDPDYAALSPVAQSHVITHMASRFAPPAGANPVTPGSSLVPPGLQGPPMGILERARQNLPQSLQDLPATLSQNTPGMPAGMETLPKDEKGNYVYRTDPIRDIKEGATSIFNFGERFANDPLGTIASLAGGVSGLGRSGVGSAIAEGVKGGLRPVTYGMHNLRIPASIAGGAAGHFAGMPFGHAGSALGAVVGAGAPIAAAGLPELRLPEVIGNVAAPPRAPLWQGVEAPPVPPPPDFTPIPGELPTGRKVGGIQNMTEPPPMPPKPGAASELPTIYDDIAKGMTGKKYSKLDPASQETVRKLSERVGGPPAATYVPPPPPTPPPASSVPLSEEPENAAGFKHSAPHTDLLRQFHAEGKKLDLGPESPAGKSARLSPTAQSVYGVSGEDLNYGQLQSIVEFLNTHKRLPTPGDIKTGVFKPVK